MRDRGPRVVQEKVRLEFSGGHYGFHRNDPDGQLCDVWLFEDSVTPTGFLHGPAGVPREEQRNVAATYEDLRSGHVLPEGAPRGHGSLNHVEAAINYPEHFPSLLRAGLPGARGQGARPRQCLRIYNDWIIDDWGGGAGAGRLIPLTLVPLWDPALAAEEVRRCADKGSYAIAFSENPSKLGCATMYSGEWDVLWEVCARRPT